MKVYLGALKEVLENGSIKQDRTGVGTISTFGLQQRYNLAEAFPAVTTKKLAWRSVVSELLWFIEGSGDEKRLREILHGSADSEKGTIWTANATAPGPASHRRSARGRRQHAGNTAGRGIRARRLHPTADLGRRAGAIRA